MEEVVEYFSWSSGKYDQVKLKPLQTRERERKNDGNSEFKNTKTVMRLLVLLTVSIS